MYNLNWHRSFDLCKLVDARRHARCECFLSNISLIGRVDARRRARSERALRVKTQRPITVMPWISIVGSGCWGCQHFKHHYRFFGPGQLVGSAVFKIEDESEFFSILLSGIFRHFNTIRLQNFLCLRSNGKPMYSLDGIPYKSLI